MWPLTRASVPANPQHILQYPKDLDAEILNGLEIPDDVLTSEGGGAGWAGKRVPMAAFYCGLDDWLRLLLTDCVTQAIEPLVLLNFGRDEQFEVTTKPLAEQAMEQQSNAGAGQLQRPGGFAPPPQPPARMSLDPLTAVGEGVLSAAELVQAAKALIEQRVPQLMSNESSWVPYRGPRGGQGWRNKNTNRILYRRDRPGEAEAEGPSVEEEEEGETEPEVGDRGPVFREFYHDAAGAVAKLIQEQGGEAIAALHHQELGDIDLVWGDAGDERGGAFGLAHIIDEHPEVVPHLQGILNRAKVRQRSEERVILRSKKHQAVVQLTWEGEERRWLLTAFKTSKK